MGENCHPGLAFSRMQDHRELHTLDCFLSFFPPHSDVLPTMDTKTKAKLWGFLTAVWFWVVLATVVL